MLKQAKPVRRGRWQSGIPVLLVMALQTACPLAFCEEPPDQKPAYPLWDGQETVAEYAQRFNLPPTQTLDLGNGVKLELVLIPAGQFIMGTPEPETPTETVAVGQTIVAVCGTIALGLLMVIVARAIRKRQRPKFSLGWLLVFTFTVSVALYGGVRWYKTLEAWREYTAAKARYASAYQSEKPAHPVTLTKPFYMSKFAVTQEQYQQVAGANPSSFKGKDNPVEQVSWDEARKFCEQVTAHTKQTVRLPTEAEWEYGCRAGTKTTYYSGDTDQDLDRVAWYGANSKSTTHPVGQKEANAFGLFDMHGNVWQWCEDWWEDDYYSKSPTEAPQGPAQGAGRVLRGGSWSNNPRGCRAADRLGSFRGRRDILSGFRVVVSASRTP